MSLFLADSSAPRSTIVSSSRWYWTFQVTRSARFSLGWRKAKYAPPVPAIRPTRTRAPRRRARPLIRCGLGMREAMTGAPCSPGSFSPLLWLAGAVPSVGEVAGLSVAVVGQVILLSSSRCQWHQPRHETERRARNHSRHAFDAPAVRCAYTEYFLRHRKPYTVL